MRNQLEPEEGRVEQNIQKNLLIDISLLLFNLSLRKKENEETVLFVFSQSEKKKKDRN